MRQRMSCGQRGFVIRARHASSNCGMTSCSGSYVKHNEPGAKRRQTPGVRKKHRRYCLSFVERPRRRRKARSGKIQQSRWPARTCGGQRAAAIGSMVDQLISWWWRGLGGKPCFKIYGKSRRETEWRIIHIYASHRRDSPSRWPLWGGTCTTWSSDVVAVGWDFAEQILREQTAEPASRERPVEGAGGRVRAL